MISVKFSRLDIAKRSFKNMENRLKNSKPGMDEIAARAWKDVQDHFRLEEGGDNKPWPKWQRMTKTGRKRYSSRPTKRGGNKLLQDSGLLKNTIRFKSTSRDAIVYVYTKYGKFHQTGTRKMERRKFMWLSYGARKRLARLYGIYLSRGIISGI